MSEIVFFLEEASAEALLETLIPRLLPASVGYRCVVFKGKRDLDKQLARRIRGYCVPDAQFVVLRDQDAADCKRVKAALQAKCREAGRPGAVVRIACHELESWYLADLAAVENGLQATGLARLQQRRRYRNADDIVAPSRELARIAPSYQKIGGSRLIGPHLDLDNERSRSFANFIRAVRRLAERAAEAE